MNPLDRALRMLAQGVGLIDAAARTGVSIDALREAQAASKAQDLDAWSKVGGGRSDPLPPIRQRTAEERAAQALLASAKVADMRKRQTSVDPWRDR